MLFSDDSQESVDSRHAELTKPQLPNARIDELHHNGRVGGLGRLRQFRRGIGVAAGVGDAEVEIQGKPSLNARVQLAQRGAALEDQRVKAASFVQIAQEQVLSNIDDRGVATIDSGAGRGVPADLTDRQRDRPRGHLSAPSVRGSKGSRVSAICQ